MNPLEDRYFAAAPDYLLGEKLWGRFQRTQSRIHPRAWQWAAAYEHYYGEENEAGRTWSITRRGEQGEYAALRINRARTLSKARQALITSSRVTWKARASKSDVESAYACLLARALLEYDWRAGGIDVMYDKWVEIAEVFSAGYAFTEWDWTLGRDIGGDPETGRVQREGDLRTTLLAPWLVATDETRSSPEDQDWWFIRTYKPKPDLVMLHPKLLDGRDGDQAAYAILDSRGDTRLQELHRDYWENPDTTCVVHFIHRPTLALPLGMHVGMIASDVVLWRKPLVGKHGDYEAGTNPLIRLAPDEMIDTTHGWTTFFDAMGSQELLDGTEMSLATAVTTYGNPIALIEKTSDQKPQKLAEAGSVWNYAPNGQPPKWMEPVPINEGILKYRAEVKEDQQAIFALNDAALGKSEGAEKNAQSDALKVSMAVQAVSPASKRSRAALMKLGEVRLKTLRKNASGERILRLVGAADRSVGLDARVWASQQLEPVDTVEIEEGNPLENTPQGRWAIFDQYRQLGLIKTMEDADALLATGRLEPAVDAVRDESLLIRAENEMLSRGEKPFAHPLQNHMEHFRKHVVPTLSVSALKTVAVLQAVDQHCDEHYQLYFGVSMFQDPMAAPRVRFLLGLEAAPPMAPGQPQPMPQAGGPGAPPPGAPPGGPGGPPPGPGQAPSTSSETPSPMQPVQPPNNPLTGSQFDSSQPPVH